MLALILGLFTLCSFSNAQDVVGQRPYEMDWANRTQDTAPPLVDFEDLAGWTVDKEFSITTFEQTREQQIWDKYVGKLTYRGLKGGNPVITIRPPKPIPIAESFDAVTLWCYGNNWGYAPDPQTPQVNLSALFADNNGKKFSVYLYPVDWVEWNQLHKRLTPEQIKMVRNGASFLGIEVAGGRNTQDRVIFLDNLAVFTEKFAPLTFEPRPERGIPMFPGQTIGTNTGPGKLPFPTRPETILPDNLTTKFTTAITREGDTYSFTYKGEDGVLTYKYLPQTGTWSDITATWEGRGKTFQPCVGGGIKLSVNGTATVPEKLTLLRTHLYTDRVETTWRAKAGEVSIDVTYTLRLWNKSLVIDTVARGGKVAEVAYGYASGLDTARLVQNPYYVYTYGTDRPSIAVSGPVDKPVFLAGNIDWYLSNSSIPFGAFTVDSEHAWYNGGVRYVPKTDGLLNDCFERFFLTVSPQFEECLPVIPNPMSPWKHITGTKLWRAHGAGNREADKAYWKQIHRYGMREMIITDHETGWRDSGESFTFRTRPAPGKGGDQGQYDYSRYMQDELGFVYGPYNNFTDFAPVNEYWNLDMVGRWSDMNLQHAWMRCYGPKPARAIEYAARQPYINEAKFKFSTAYCDVHTAVAPWDKVDYDSRVPGAGTFNAVLYLYGEIMLHQKTAWDGPVYSEGGHHFPYVGLTDGNYGQDQSSHLGIKPWLVDFDLRQMHDLGCNFGMGNPDMFWAADRDPKFTPEGAEMQVDRFLAATVAFGHPGFLHLEGGMHNALRSYYMLQQLHSKYCLASATDIRYLNAAGKLLTTSEAVASDAWKRSQIVTRYSDGTVTVVNGSLDERMVVAVDGHTLDLPTNGYAGWTKDGRIFVLSGDNNGKRCDYSVSPEYIYVDGRGRGARFEKAASSGLAVCRILEDNKYEVIPYNNVECGFAVSVDKAIALNEAGEEIGAAELRISRNLTWIMPVEGAFSYILAKSNAPVKSILRNERDIVVAGESVVIQGKQKYEFVTPQDVKPGQRIWQQFDGQWIDFTVTPLADIKINLVKNNIIEMTLTSGLKVEQDAVIRLDDKSVTVKLIPGKPVEATITLDPSAHEETNLMNFVIEAGNLRQTVDRGMRVAYELKKLTFPNDRYETGMRLRGQAEQSSFGSTGGWVSPGEFMCGGDLRPALKMHPAYIGAIGYAFALFDKVTLPSDVPCAFRASVGKGDGSFLGDGILYKINVVEENGTETTVGEHIVKQHQWEPITGDLSQWAGKTIQIKIITDPGVDDDSSGDWACWSEMRLTSSEKVLNRTISENTAGFERMPAPFPATGVTAEDLKNAVSGFLHYDGCGLEGGSGQYGSMAIVNGIVIGPMAQAGGDEMHSQWAEKVSVPLTPEAIKTLGFLNVFELDNHGADYFKVRRFWIELKLQNGKTVSSEIAPAVYTQPGGWAYGEGIMVPHGQRITVDICFNNK